MAAVKTVLVTGGAGFIGSHLVKALLEKKYRLVIIDNLSTGKRTNVPDETVLIEADISDLERLRSVFAEYKIDAVFHLAARVTIRDSVRHFIPDAQVNLIGTCNVLLASIEAGVRKFIYASSMAVYADSPQATAIDESYTTEPISPYGISKLAGEKYCLLLAAQASMSCSVLRFFNTYGIGQCYTPYVGVITIFIHRLLEGKGIQIYGDGLQKRDFIHVNDIVQANMLALEGDDTDGVFNVGTGRATTVNELAVMLRDAINPNAEISYLGRHSGELVNSIADIHTAQHRLGYSPKCLLPENLEQIIQYERSNVSAC
jgi:UDP-glucose 4-epimerase